MCLTVVTRTERVKTIQTILASIPIGLEVDEAMKLVVLQCELMMLSTRTIKDYRNVIVELYKIREKKIRVVP